MKNRLEQIINLKLNNFEVKFPVAKGSEPVDVQESKEAKKLGNPYGAFAEYPWDQCIADQMERYGDEGIANRICGWIKANYQTNFQEGDSLENACWEGWEAIGLKEKDGRMVPNCVPVKASKESFVIPEPEGNEDEQAFVSRCIAAIYDEYGQEQSAAICYSKWREKK